MTGHFAWSERQGDFRWHLILKCLNDLICSATIIIGMHKSLSHREEFEEEPDPVQACWKALGGRVGEGGVWVISLFQAGKHKSQGKGSKGKGWWGQRDQAGRECHREDRWSLTSLFAIFCWIWVYHHIWIIYHDINISIWEISHIRCVLYLS